MTRRSFIKQLALRSLSTGALWNAAMPSMDAAAEEAATTGNHTYIPLDGRSLEEIAQSRAHHGAGRFINPFSRVEKGNLWPVLRWKLFAKNKFSNSYDEEPTVPVTIDWNRVRRHDGLSVTFIRHASIMIKDMDRYFLVDPVFGDIFPFIQDFSPLTGDLSDMPRPDRVLITHGHYDHLDIDTLKTIGGDVPVISPLGYDKEFSSVGTGRRRALDWYDRERVHGCDITLLPSNHWTMRNPIIGPNTSLWGSYLLRTRSGPTIYVSGDTGYFDGFRQIGQMADIDLAIVNLGAYEPRWFMAASHMNPEETVQAFQELGARRLLIVHWGTFRLGDEPVHYPIRDIQRAMRAAGLEDRLSVTTHGNSVFFPEA